MWFIQNLSNASEFYEKLVDYCAVRLTDVNFTHAFVWYKDRNHVDFCNNFS